MRRQFGPCRKNERGGEMSGNSLFVIYSVCERERDREGKEESGPLKEKETTKGTLRLPVPVRVCACVCV